VLSEAKDIPLDHWIKRDQLLKTHIRKDIEQLYLNVSYNRRTHFLIMLA